MPVALSSSPSHADTNPFVGVDIGSRRLRRFYVVNGFPFILRILREILGTALRVLSMYRRRTL